MKELSENQAQIRVRVTVILRRDDGKVCFVRHRKKDRVYWLLPGGGQAPLESALEAAQRELMEELEIKAESFSLAFVRESMNEEIGRHIQFLVFEGKNPDFSTLGNGEDERVEGFDFFDAEEIMSRPVYPAMKDDLLKYLKNEPVEIFKTLDWIP